MADKSSNRSVISATTVVRGNISGEGAIEILGRVRGDVEVTGDISLGPDAAVLGNISGANLNIAGSVQGDLTGSESLLIESGAKIVGDLRAPTLGIAEGALVRGNVQTDGASKSLALRTSTRVGSSSGLQRVKARTAPAQPPALPKRAAVKRATAPSLTSVTSVAKKPPAPPTKTVAKKTAKKKQPPAPVVSAPKRGAKGRKKAAKR